VSVRERDTFGHPIPAETLVLRTVLVLHKGSPSRRGTALPGSQNCIAVSTSGSTFARSRASIPTASATAAAMVCRVGRGSSLLVFSCKGFGDPVWRLSILTNQAGGARRSRDALRTSRSSLTRCFNSSERGVSPSTTRRGVGGTGRAGSSGSGQYNRGFYPLERRVSSMAMVIRSPLKSRFRILPLNLLNLLNLLCT
jgi:hypothetical protein